MRRARLLAVGPAALLASSCTFGMLKTDECLRAYAEGMMIAVSQASRSGQIVAEGYGYCLDGRRRADAIVAPLRAHGFATTGPTKHFEVPGGWCVAADRATSPERFEPMKSLQAMCAIGGASRAYMTGGKLTTSDGTAHYVRSAGDRKAREELDERLAKDKSD